MAAATKMSCDDGKKITYNKLACLISWEKTSGRLLTLSYFMFPLLILFFTYTNKGDNRHMSEHLKENDMSILQGGFWRPKTSVASAKMVLNGYTIWC